MAALGWFLIVLGCASLTVGLLGGAREVLLHPRAGPEMMSPMKLIELFLEILKKGGWQALVGVGFILLIVGLALVGADVFSADDASAAAL